MAEQITQNPEALKLLFHEDIYLIPNEMPVAEILPDTVAKPPVLAVPEPVAKEFKSVGKNARKVLILVNDEQQPISSADGEALLWNLVKAIKLAPDDVAVCNYAQYQGSTFDELTAVFQPQLFLSFGVSPQELGLQKQEPHLLATQKSIPTIFALPLHELNVTIPAKKLLWSNLQQLNIT